MSSILDALRRIEREQETGPLTPIELEPEHPRLRSRRGWIWSAAAVAVTVIAVSGGAAWWLSGGSTPGTDQVVIAKGPTPAPEGTSAEATAPAVAAEPRPANADLDRNEQPTGAMVAGTEKPAEGLARAVGEGGAGDEPGGSSARRRQPPPVGPGARQAEAVALAPTVPAAKDGSDRPAPLAEATAPAPVGEAARPVTPAARTAAADPVTDAAADPKPIGVAQRAIAGKPPSTSAVEVEPPAQLVARAPLPATRVPAVASPRPATGSTADRAQHIREEIARRRAAQVAPGESSGNSRTRRIEEAKLRTELDAPPQAPADPDVGAAQEATTAEGKEQVSQRRPRGAPYVRVSFLYYSREPSRRRAMLTVNRGELLTVYEGQSVETLNVERILRDEVHFRYEGKLFAVRPRF